MDFKNIIMNFEFYSNLKYFFVLLWISLFSLNTLSSQNFTRVETQSKLGILAENNAVAVADYDGDNDLDLFVVAKAKDQDGVEISHSRLLKNNNDGTFEDVTTVSGLINLFPDDNTEGFFGLDGFDFTGGVYVVSSEAHFSNSILAAIESA
jgi:hypothetical protein